MTTNSPFYTYIHSKPGGEPFYVGKGKGKRSHDFANGRNKSYLEIVALFGAENIEVQVFEKESEEDAFKSEIEYIKSLREAGYEICNRTNGGEGKSQAANLIEVVDPVELKITDLNKLEKIVSQLENAFELRNQLIYKVFSNGVKQKTIGTIVNLSESRVKAICLEQKAIKGRSK
jgi:hypothetical protein